MRCVIVSHTHWDREWYKTFQAFRARLVDTVDRVLDLLAADASPDLIVVLVLDAFRPDLLTRFADRMPTLARVAAESLDRRADHDTDGPRLLQQAAPRPEISGVVRHRHNRPACGLREQCATHAIAA